MSAAEQLAAFERARLGRNIRNWPHADIEQHNRLLNAKLAEDQHGRARGDALPVDKEIEDFHNKPTTKNNQ